MFCFRHVKSEMVIKFLATRCQEASGYTLSWVQKEFKVQHMYLECIWSHKITGEKTYEVWTQNSENRGTTKKDRKYGFQNQQKKDK